LDRELPAIRPVTDLRGQAHRPDPIAPVQAQCPRGLSIVRSNR
jgi:hypothetical protein